MQLSDPATYARIYEEHHRGVHAAAMRITAPAPSARISEAHPRGAPAAAMRILHAPVQAQDVAQDVFVRIWRNPQKFDARRGSSAATCASWRAAGRSTCGGRARPPA